MKLKYIALPTEPVQQLRAGGLDANGQIPEVATSDGQGNPCRFCLSEIAVGEKMLILAYRPFHSIQPYAELGPIFLCASHCQRHPGSSELPSMFKSFNKILIRAYTKDDRIIDGSGQVVDMHHFNSAVQKLFESPTTAYVHMRSASNNCYQCRIERFKTS